ncbi:MAG: hypothetical protein Q9187_004606 [Circinaria calcarea]
MSSPDPESNPLDIQDREGKTPLHHAVLNGTLKEVERLLSLGATVDIQDNQSNQALHYAASRGFHGIIELLLKWKTDVNAIGSEQKTPIHMALRYPKAFRVLLKAHPILSAGDERGDTALHLAISLSANYPLGGKIVEKLLSSGADVNVRNNAGVTPFHIVVNHTQPRAGYCNYYLAIFLERNANLSLQNNDGELPFAVFLEKSNLCWMRNTYRTQTNVDASSIFKAFIRNGADPNTRLKNGEVILHEYFTSQFYNHGILESLCGTANIYQPSKNGDFPLHSILRQPCHIAHLTSRIEILFRRGANPNQVNNAGDPPIMVLLKNNAVNCNERTLDDISTILRTLLNGGADPMQNDASGELPIYVVVKSYIGKAQETLVKLLVDSFIKRDAILDENLGTDDDQWWWCQYSVLCQSRYWDPTTQNLISGEGMPASIADILPKMLLGMAAIHILPDVKATLVELKERLGLQHADTQAEQNHFLRILRDCRWLELDVEPSWYHFLLDLFE